MHLVAFENCNDPCFWPRWRVKGFSGSLRFRFEALGREPGGSIARASALTCVLHAEDLGQ
jgi:hypothetical protein